MILALAAHRARPVRGLASTPNPLGASPVWYDELDHNSGLLRRRLRDSRAQLWFDSAESSMHKRRSGFGSLKAPRHRRLRVAH